VISTLIPKECQVIPIIKANGYGLGSVEVAKTLSEYVETFADANRFWCPSKAAQAYVIALGVNDLFGQNQPIGSIEDIDSADYRNNKPTFLGYYAQIIARYKEIQPKAKFFLVTMPYEKDNDGDTRRIDHAKALYALAEHFDNCYVIDLYKYGPHYDADFRSRFFLYGHMNASGYIFTARLIDSYIDYIIRKNPKDFELVPYIGTDLK
jgi:lysophospholipase L1-like esterase